MNTWTFFWCNLAAEEFSVCGIPFYANRCDISKKFVNTQLRVETTDPIYGTVTPYYVYALNHDGGVYHVAYQEHTPGVYLAFADEKSFPHCSPRFKHDPNGQRDRWVRID